MPVTLQETAASLQALMSVAEPKWPVVQEAAPTLIVSTEVVPEPLNPTGYETAIVLPDMQIGFRQYEDGTLDPFHDVKAISVAHQITAYMQEQTGVNQVVLLGDFLDLPAQSRFEQENTFANTTQPAIDYGHMVLAQIRANAPDADIILVEGNHDLRLGRAILNNAAAAFGLKKANLPASWPVMSLPFLLRMDELGVQYIDAYPAGVHWINDNLRAIHGDKVRSNGSTAAAYTNEMPHVSTIFGHTHRLEVQSRTTFDRQGKMRNRAISPGTLSRVDGAVPSVKGAVGLDGRPARNWENWQQGMAVISYKPEGEFHTELVEIEDGAALFRGKRFVA